MAEAKLPTSRLGRFARLAALGTRAGAGRVAAALGADSGEAKLAETAADALGTMRGLALKLGQMASYVDGFVPDEHKDVYERTMKSLRDAAPTMSPDAAARVVRGELGAPPDELFAAWSVDPFASASIGQVHHARLDDGREVAVKVQYEGIARAVSADLSNASLFGTLLGPLGGKFAVKEQIAEMRARFTEELDYRHEASRQAAFGRIFADHPRVRIPGVVADRSAGRVITTELATGLDFEAACARPEAERAAWAETLWEFVFGALLGHGLFNADPHPGNYLFVSGPTDAPTRAAAASNSMEINAVAPNQKSSRGNLGEVWFLDFGCTRELPPDRLRQVRAVHRAAARRDGDALAEAARVMLGIPEGSEQARLARPYILEAFAPMLSPEPFRITREYARWMFDEMKENARSMMKGSRREFAPLPAEWLFFNRLQLGFYSVLARLDVAVDYNAVDAGCLPAE